MRNIKLQETLVFFLFHLQMLSHLIFKQSDEAGGVFLLYIWENQVFSGLSNLHKIHPVN